MSQDFFDKWTKFIVCLRLLLSTAALFIMAFFGIVSSEGRPVAAIGVLIALLVLYWDVQKVRRWRHAGQSD